MITFIFVNDKNEQIQMKILKCIADQIKGDKHNIILDLGNILLQSLFSSEIYVQDCYLEVKIFFNGTPLHSGVN